MPSHGTAHSVTSGAAASPAGSRSTEPVAVNASESGIMPAISLFIVVSLWAA